VTAAGCPGAERRTDFDELARLGENIVETAPQSKKLVPVDGSPEAARAAPYAARLLEPQGELIIVCVVPNEVRDPHRGHDSPTLSDRFQVTYLNAAREAIADAAGQVRDALQKVRTEVVYGDPAEQITRLAEEEQVDLIVMTTQGRGAAGRALFGSVADRVARAGTRPTLLLRAGTHLTGPDRIIVPLDSSDLAEQSLPMAMMLAARLGLPVRLLRVVELDEILGAIRLNRREIPYELTSGPSYDEARERCEHSARTYLERHAEALRARGAVVDVVVRVGTPAIVLLDDLHAGDLAVMTTHGHGGMQRWLLGSIAEKLVRHAAAPILLVRAAQEASTV
jgi:nucleotide-binding universal stress UspA family protein